MIPDTACLHNVNTNKIQIQIVDAHITNSHAAEGLIERSGVTRGWPIASM